MNKNEIKMKKMKKEKENKKELNINDWEVIEIEEKKEEKSIFDEFITDLDWEKTESLYKNKILNKRWIKDNKYIDIDKFILNISSFHYFDSHCLNLEKNFKEKNYINIFSGSNFISNPNIKKLCRQGIPPKFIRVFLLKYFGVNEINKNNYKKLYSMIFKEHDVNNLDDYVPYYTGKKTLKESLPFYYLKEEVIKELKIILWMINEIYRNIIIYCPILIKIISLILIFCNKYETFEIICKLIDKEKNKEKEKIGIKNRLGFTKKENEIIIDSIESCINEVNYKRKNEYDEIFKKLKIEKREIYQNIFNDFFINYINFYGLIRFLPLYLNEGFKSIFRLICSLENIIFEEEITFKNKEEVIKIIKEKSKKIDIDELFKSSFNYKFTINKIEEDNEGTSIENNEFYLPYYKGGDLLTDYEIIHLWELLPLEYKIKNASIIYQATKNGYNLPNILELEYKYDKNIYILFLVETTDGDKFGFVNSNLLIHTDNKYQRPNSTFLFTIRPEFKLYSPKDDTDEIFYITNKDFIFGNGTNGPAIQLNQDIMKGISYEGGCFNNPCLVSNPDGHFIVTKLEIFKLE